VKLEEAGGSASGTKAFSADDADIPRPKAVQSPTSRSERIRLEAFMITMIGGTQGG
jgi:hypothetical protein